MRNVDLHWSVLRVNHYYCLIWCLLFFVKFITFGLISSLVSFMKTVVGFDMIMVSYIGKESVFIRLH